VQKRECKYYLIPKLGCLDPDKNLPYEYRIAEIPVDFPFVPSNIKGHNSLRHLRKYDEIWKAFDSVNHKAAIKICDKKFILDANDFILFPSDENFNKYSYTVLMHSIFGEFDKELSGVHLLSHLNKDLTIEKVLRDEDCNGIWEAEIKVYNQRRNKYYSKTSTFFPKNWTPSHFMSECFYAFKKIYNPKIGGCIESLTKSNIPVRLVFKNDELNSIYPIYEK